MIPRKFNIRGAEMSRNYVDGLSLHSKVMRKTTSGHVCIVCCASLASFAMQLRVCVFITIYVEPTLLPSEVEKH